MWAECVVPVARRVGFRVPSEDPYTERTPGRSTLDTECLDWEAGPEPDRRACLSKTVSEMLFPRWLLVLALLCFCSCRCDGKVWRGSARLSPKKPWVALTSFAFDLGVGEVRARREREREKLRETEAMSDRFDVVSSSLRQRRRSTKRRLVCAMEKTADLLTDINDSAPQAVPACPT